MRNKEFSQSGQQLPDDVRLLMEESQKALEANPQPHEGPASYVAWKLDSPDSNAQPIEYPLYSDASFRGDAPGGLGPIQLLNARVGPRDPDSPALVLRLRTSSGNAPLHPLDLETDVRNYHGGGFADEIAALLSLILCCRLMAAGPSRMWLCGDSLGRPVSGIGRPAPYLPVPNNQARILPQLVGIRSLADAQQLSAYRSLPPTDASKLVRAARLYQEAVWISEAQPATAWLWLVAAVEAIASPWQENQRKRPDPNPKHELGPKKRFIKFILDRVPDPYAPAASRLWAPEALEAALEEVYAWRGSAVHDGVPFPEAMCMPPASTDAGFSPYPLGVGVTANGGSWLNRDTPMLLHAFEHLVRGSIVRWWLASASKPCPGADK